MTLLLKQIHTADGRLLSEADDALLREGHLYLTLMIGPTDEEGGHLFNLTVLDGDKAVDLIYQKKVIWGRHHLMLDHLTAPSINDAIIRIIENCDQPTFWNAAQNLSRYFAWEYEDYVS